MQTIYLDNAATTRVDDDIAAAALSAMCEDYGNPSSLHGLGVGAERLMKAAAQRLIAALGAKGGRVIFTGSGTEADNLAILGGVPRRAGRGKHIITTAIEHAAVLGPMRELERRGFELTVLKPDASGTVTPEALAAVLRPDTVFVSVMAVCNETGGRQDIAAMVRLTREKSPHALFHTDAVQAFGKLPFTVRDWGVDLLTLSGHKLCAPKGVGALYIADRVQIDPIQFGGGQQASLRPGTENVPLIHALGLAAEKAVAGRADTLGRVEELYAQLRAGLAALPGVCLNSPPDGSPYILNFSVPGYRSEVVLHFLERQGIYVSSGSACGRGEPSHVLTAMGLDRAVVDSALRISFSKHNTPGDVAALLKALSEAQTGLIKAR